MHEDYQCIGVCKFSGFLSGLAIRLGVQHFLMTVSNELEPGGVPLQTHGGQGLIQCLRVGSRLREASGFALAVGWGGFAAG